MATLEKWVIGSDKKPRFQIEEDGTGDLIPLVYLSGYGVVFYDHYGTVIGKFGNGLTGFSSAEVNIIDENTFEIALDKSVNTLQGYVFYRLFVAWYDSDFTDDDFNSYSSDRVIIYYSENP